ncbi:MAG: tetratricopeptide repeat protein, partial [Armatimonadota bacterium]
MHNFVQRKFGSSKFVGLIIALSCLVNIAALFSTSANQPGEEAALKALVERFFDAYAKRDLDGFMRLWSEKSPDYEFRKGVMQQILAKADYAFSNLTFKQIQLEGEKARLRILVTLTEIDLKTKAQSTRKLDRIFSCVKEADGWKIWRYYPAAEELAIALINAATDEEREKLLEKENELLTIELVQVLLILGDQRCKQNDLKSAVAIYQLAQNIAQRIGDWEGLVQSRDREGIAHDLMGQLKEAMGAYEESINILQTFIEQLQKAGEQEKVNRALQWRAALLNDLGSFYQNRIGDPYRALAKYQEGLALSRKIGDRFLEAAALNNVGGLHLDFGKFV